MSVSQRVFGYLLVLAALAAGRRIDAACIQESAWNGCGSMQKYAQRNGKHRRGKQLILVSEFVFMDYEQRKDQRSQTSRPKPADERCCCRSGARTDQ